MENAAAHLRRPYERALGAFVVWLWCMGIACRQAAPNPAAETDKKAGMQQAVTSFRQVLTSSKTDLKLHPGEDTKIPVHIQNPGTETWVSAGPYPVNVSYKWYKEGQMMRIEGERTALPSAVGPNQAVDVEVRVVAPPDPGEYALRVTLVQEAVAWFMMNSHKFLALPVTIE
jgi:hypothetical protein